MTDKTISLNAVIDALEQSINIFEAEDRIRDLPSVKPQEPKTGHWIDKGSLSCRCDQCGCKNNRETKFCPNCGKKMVEPQERSDKE